jgi:hypothetical protein
MGVLRWLAVVGIAFVSIVSSLWPTHAGAQIGGFSLTLNASPPSVTTGQTVTFNYSAQPPVTSPPFPTLSGLTIAFGDASSQSLPLPLGS